MAVSSATSHSPSAEESTTYAWISSEHSAKWTKKRVAPRKPRPVGLIRSM
jgi:hypothetical protein